MSEALWVGGGIALAAAGWPVMFRLGRRDRIWPRTWLVAVVLIGYSVTALAALGRLRTTVEPIDITEVAIGLAAAIAWVVATHIGHRVLGVIAPGFIEQVRDLYLLQAASDPRSIVGPVVAMAVAEELLFRGLFQGLTNIVVATALYAAVQLFERKWALVLAALVGGLVWGGLFWWRDGLVAPVVAHMTWTATLLFVWPLPGEDPSA